MRENVKKTIKQYFFPELYCIDYEKIGDMYGVRKSTLRSPLMEAVCSNDLRAAHFYVDIFKHRNLLEQSDPAMYNETPLVEAIFRKYNSMAFLLMKLGANPDNRANGTFSPLEAAICANNQEMVQALIPFAKINQPNIEGDHPLLFACLKGNMYAVEEILKRDASLVNKTNTAGLSPLMIAAHQGHENIVRILLGYNAKPNLMSQGKTAADFALANGYKKLAIKLRIVSIGHHYDPFSLVKVMSLKENSRS